MPSAASSTHRVGCIVKTEHGFFQARATQGEKVKRRCGPAMAWPTDDRSILPPPPDRAHPCPGSSAAIDGITRFVFGSAAEAQPEELDTLALNPNGRTLRKLDPQNTIFANELTCSVLYVRDLTRVVDHFNKRNFDGMSAFDIEETQALLGVSPNRDVIFVAFRGTSNIADAMTSLDGHFVSYPLGGSGHRGFARYIEHVNEPLTQQLQGLRAKYPKAKLLLTGYSLGAGAVLNYVTKLIASNVVSANDIDRIITAGSPRAFDLEAEAALRNVPGGRKLCRRIERQVYRSDIITMLPDSLALTGVANAVGVPRSILSALAGAGPLFETLKGNTGIYTHTRCKPVFYSGRDPIPAQSLPLVRVPSAIDHHRLNYIQAPREWQSAIQS